MKNWIVAKWSLGLVLAALPLMGGCVQESTNPVPAIVSTTNQQNRAAEPAAVADTPPPEAAVQTLENAPGKIVSLAEPPAQAAQLAPSAAEIAKLAQSGLEENVMLAFVTNSTSAFNLGSDQIIYLNDIGVPGSVVTAMIQHDQALKPSSPAPVAPPPPVAASSPVPAAAPAAMESQAPPVVVESAPQQAEVPTTYFYDSLSPYGNWIDIQGVGRCWQPCVSVVNRGWTPYCNGGRWVYSDCGWYWASDYSWGWAPFHYGRWFRHGFWGWCWAPGTVWGPAWVSWRYNSGYCGWAPLPPTACYQPSIGFTYYGNSVSAGFSFGLGASCFTFVAAGNFCNPQPYRYCVPPHQVTQIFNNTTIVNPVVEGHGNSRFHKGIPTERIAEATHTDIKPVRIHETTDAPRNGRNQQFDRNNGTLTVFHPRLPESPAYHNGSRAVEGVKPAIPSPDNNVRRFSPDTTMHKGIPQPLTGATDSASSGRRNDNVTVFRAPRLSSQPSDPHPGSPADVVRNNPASGNGQSRNTREIGSASTTSNSKEIPPNSLIIRGRPNTGVQTKPDATVASAPSPVERNNSLLNRRPQQITVTQPQTQTTTPQQNQFGWRGQQIPRAETPRFQPRDERAFAQPTAPVQSPPGPRIYQAAPATSGTPSGWAPQRSVTTVGPAPVAPATPRIETRAAPAAQTPQPVRAWRSQ